MDTVGTLCNHPTAVADLYAELQNILLQSYGLSATQKTACLLDHPGQGSHKPSVLMDQLIALKPDLLDAVIQVLFFQEMPGYILDMVNPKDYQNLYDLMQLCNNVWENRDPQLLPPPPCSGPTPWSGATVAAPHPFAGSGPPKPSPLTTIPPHWPRPEVARSVTAGATTTPVSGQQAGSVTPTAHSRKTSRPAVAACTAAASPAEPPPAV